MLDGNADRSRAVLVRVDDRSQVAIIAIEDVIADRMGQFSSSPQGVREMLEQAVTLYRLGEHIDADYLDRRIKQETSGTYDLAFLKEHAARR